MKTVFIIVDWGGNRIFPQKEFNSFDDGWHYIYENVDNSLYEETDNEDDNEYQDIFVIPKV